MRREEGGRLRNPRGRLSLEREAGGTPGMGHWCPGVRGHQRNWWRETPCRLVLKDTMVKKTMDMDVKKHCGHWCKETPRTLD